ncbi:MAG: type IV fimbrial bioproteinis protein FimT [bacterium]|nr:MAG: type IV fimbrial bioproteinis protein FimT [bacterium]
MISRFRNSTGDASPGERGFSLIELMVSLTLMTIMFAVGLPALTRSLRTNRVLGSAGNLAAELRQARQRAVSEENQVIFSWSLADDHYRWHDDDDNDGTTDTGEYVSDWRELPDGVDLVDGATAFGAASVTFRPNGSASLAGQLRVVNADNLGRTVQLVATSGLVKVIL